jgi:hypothetical protein
LYRCACRAIAVTLEQLNDGAWPAAALLADKKGALYRTTFAGGGTGCDGVGCGTVFKLMHPAVGYAESLLYRFQEGNDGESPLAGLIADTKGALHGTTYMGGAGGNCPDAYVELRAYCDSDSFESPSSSSVSPPSVVRV